ncbi:Spt20 family-domain-containing protein [Aspergillus varians]
MATAISKTASHPPKMKRPPPPFVQTGVNGVKPQQSSSPPPTTSKRLPGAGQSAAASSTSHPILNGANGIGNSSNTPIKGPLGRTRKEAQKPGDQGIRIQKPMSKTSSSDNDRRSGKTFPEPHVKTTPYILKKFAKFPPSLILHLHPTHFRFEQQDGSFPYNSEMKVIIEHIRAGTVPHDMMEELLRANVRFYEGCLIVRVIDHKSVSAQTRKSTAPSLNDNNTPFSIHNYNEHITPSAYVPYPKQNQLASEKSAGNETAAEQSDTKDSVKRDGPPQDNSQDTTPASQHKQTPGRPRVFTTVLHPTPRSLQAELTLLATTPDPKAAKQAASTSSRPQNQSATGPSSPGAQSERGHVAKRQKMLVEPQELLECESKLTRALAPPLFLDPVNSLEGVHSLLKYMESPIHRDAPPSPKRRKRTVAELAADEALAAEEERFMLIMDERLEPTTSGAAGGPKSATVDDAGGAVPFEPRFSRFKTLENIRIQHEEKTRRENETKMKQELVKRQQQEQERERRRITEQRQAEEHAKEENRRQHLAAQQAQAQLAAQQQNRHVMAQPNGISQAPQSSPVVRNQTPLNTSSPLVSSTMVTQASVPMAMTPSMQGAGSPQRPPSALQHGHPGMMSHPMVPSRSQQSRHGTPQMTHGTPAMSQATPIMRNVTPTQRMSHASPPRSSMAPTPVMGQAMMATPQMGGQMNLTPQQQQQFLMQRQQLLAQQGHVNHSQLTPQQFAQLHANAHAQHTIQNHQQQVMQQQQQQQPNPQPQQQKFPNPQAYQAQLMRAQLAQMQMAQHQQQQHRQQQQPPQQPQPQPQGQPQPQPQQGQMLQNNQQINAQQQQILMAAAQANGGQLPQNMQGMNMQPRVNATQRYTHLYQQRLLQLRQDMASRLMPQYGPPTQYPPQVAQEYSVGLEQAAKGFVQDIMRRDRAEIAAAQQRQAQAAHHAQAVQQQQHNMMQNGMGK